MHIDSQPGGTRIVAQRGRTFRVTGDARMAIAAGEFTSGFEEGTLQFFDATLPACDRFIDFGAYVGFTTLYAASTGVEVFAFEPSPGNHAMLAANVRCNPDLAARIRLFRHGVADRNGSAMLYAKAFGDSGSSIYQTVERQSLLSAVPDAEIVLRDAAEVLHEIGTDERTLLKIDIEGAEYAVLPALSALLAERRPFLHVSFHPFNLVAGQDEYRNAIRRIRCAMAAAEAVAAYPFVYLFSQESWVCVGTEDRLDFLRQYLLRPKPVQRIGSPQYGFIDAVGFSPRPLPALAG